MPRFCFAAFLGPRPRKRKNMRTVTLNPAKCVGCRNCEYACAFQRTSDFARKDSMIRVNYYPDGPACIPMTCLHCKEAFCLEVCPAGAISRDGETGAVKIDETRCAGCKMCMLACPFGNIHFSGTAMVSRKCDLCQGEPNCVKFCISGSLQFVEEDEAYENKRAGLDARLRNLLQQGKRRGTCE